MTLEKQNDTIYALATPHGMSAQGTIKISGSRAIPVVSRIFHPIRRGLKLSEAEGYSAIYGWVKDPKDESTIDDAIVLLMRAPHSYTGEDQVEITCHGSPFILSLVMQLLDESGARLAEPGEYTRRAFANGKMDLSQSESVADVIASTNRAALKLSLTQMKGLFRQKIEELREQLIRFASLIELELDFSEEDVEFVPREELRSQCESILEEVTELAESYKTSQVIKHGIPIAIVGATNAGKSTLLNGLLQEERAIVSNIHGTTRDIIEDTLYIEGQQFRIIDTAGIRETSDEIESIGIERALDKAASAELVLWVVDPMDELPKIASAFGSIHERVEASRILPIINKIDLAQEAEIKLVTELFAQYNLTEYIAISAKSQQDIKRLKQTLHERFSSVTVGDNEIMVTNIRQANALKEASTHLQGVLKGLDLDLSGDLLAQDLRATTSSLSSVIGEISTDDLLTSIFTHFCIGK